MIKTRILAGCVVLIGILTATTVQAQLRPGLTDFVDDAATGATQSQQNAGRAVQRMCGALGGAGGFNLQDAQLLDLYLRCNELVETARDLLDQQQQPQQRQLGYTQRSELLAALQQVSGEEIAAQGSLSTQVSAGQFANIGGRLSALRFGTAAAAARGRVAALGPASSAPDVEQAHASLSGGRALGGGAASDAEAPQARNPWGWFIESSYGFGDRDQTQNEDAFDFDSYSVTTGSDYNFGNGVLGFGVGYDNYTADFNNGLLVSGGDVEVKGVSGSLFGAWFGGGWSLNGIATYGKLESDLTRNATYAAPNGACIPACGASRSLKGSPDGSYVALGATLGYDFLAGGWQISPSLSASYRDVDVDGFDETDSAPNGGLALRYQEQSIESKRSILALALARPISRPWGVLTPNFRAEWHHEFEDDPRVLRAKYVLEDRLSGGSAAQDFSAGCTISCFSFFTDEVEADYGIAGAGLSALFSQRVQVYLYYEAVLGISGLNANSLALGIRGQF
ncbi:MAG TPA: autotransporter outer membrane beta-barrel domain-containing protein [Steroidobacteraceae bacterium]|nr:autotransporter outer membrane beta-barrel domain-containing protein [Steroidobacteraceae bacterium]